MDLIQGDLVKSRLRSDEYPLFLMVLADKNPNDTQFNGVVIKDMANCGDDYEAETGYVTNVWNTEQFELTSWEEVKPFL